jgi:hypothetical protein
LLLRNSADVEVVEDASEEKSAADFGDEEADKRVKRRNQRNIPRHIIQ